MMIYQSITKKLSARLLLTASAILLGSLNCNVYAQDTSNEKTSSNVLEEIIVTGTKRDMSMQDTPMSVSTITEKALSESPFNDVRALGSLAPGMVLSNPTGFNAVGGGMRGTGTNIILVTQDAPVSFLVDEFPLSHVTSQFVNLFDVQQIEVYRGPQGTLFGKNTTGGVISITSKKPVLAEQSGDIELEYGTYDLGNKDLYSFKGALNVPFGDTVALRIAAIGDYSDGYYTDDKATATFPDNVPLWGLYGIPAGTKPPPSVDTTVTGTGGTLGGKNVVAAKAKLLWEPSDAFSAYFITEFVRDKSDSPPGVNESVPSDLLPLLGFPGIQTAGQKDVFSTLITHNDNIQMDKGHRVNVDGYYLHLDWKLPKGVIKSITGYRSEDQMLPSTYTGESFLTLFDSTRNTKRKTFQQEFRFISNFGGPLEFVTGASYYRDTFDFLAFFSVGLTSLLPTFDADTNSFVTADGYVSLDTRALTDYQFQGTSQTRNEYAWYFDTTYDFGNDWQLTAGFRYSYDKKDFLRFVDGGGPCTAYTDPQDVVMVDGVCHDSRSQYTSRAGINPRAFDGWDIPLPLSAFGTVVNASKHWSQPTYRLVLDRKFAENNMAYLSFSTGFLSGGFSETCATVSRCAYNPEKNYNVEVGYKADLLDSTLRFNAAAYYTKYTDLQRAVVAAYTAADGTGQQETVTVNTGSSRAIGVDLEMDWLAAENLELRATLNWLDHKYTSGILPALRTNDVPTALEPFTVPFSPDIKLSLSATYTVPLASGASVLLSGNANYQSEAETDVFNGPNTQMQERTLVDLGVTYADAKSRYSITAYVANVLDKTYRISALPVAGLWNFTQYGPPRSFGAKISVNF